MLSCSDMPQSRAEYLMTTWSSVAKKGQLLQLRLLHDQHEACRVAVHEMLTAHQPILIPSLQFQTARQSLRWLQGIVVADH